ncbi:hypothetical protein [uncultured Shewanella sp.]|uniref:hypothetical protein n=1 Tax=Shewanella atlantica TaxID=271099 RepID=UPI002617F6EB|nr:hypothetical protein [uncultured Shewanella sp.]
MKKAILAGVIGCLFIGSATAKYLESEVAIGMASLMMCTTFYSETNMLVEGSVVGEAATQHRDAGIDKMMMTAQTSAELDRYIKLFNSSTKEQKFELCTEAMKFAKESNFGK